MTMYSQDPCCPPAALLPTGSPGGVKILTPDTPGSLRPFSATLGVKSRPTAKKHDTATSHDTHTTNTETINDGSRTNDATTDHDVDD